jgi:tetratricopeptide (TPR) repeat protein
VSPRATVFVAGFFALCAGIAVGVLKFRAPARGAVQPAAAPTREPEPDRSATRRAIAPLAPEKLVPASAGVEVRWAQLNREAITALDAGDLEKAVDAFERCHAAVPGEPVFTSNLAEAYARLSTREEEQGTEAARALSVKHLERAVELAPKREDLAKHLAQVRRLADSEKGFYMEPSEHFELSYDGARRDILWSSSDITRKLEAAYQDFGELFGVWPVEAGRSRIRVVLYKKNAFHEATGMGHWAAGLFDGAIRVPIEDLGREQATLERVLRHEVAHAFVRASGGDRVPGWLNEGLAQWLEFPFVVDRGRAVEAARVRLRGAKLVPLGELQSSLGENRTDAEVALAYTEALALCGWIESSFGERLLFDMVTASKTDEGWRGVFRSRTGTDIDAVLAELPR